MKFRIQPRMNFADPKTTSRTAASPRVLASHPEMGQVKRMAPGKAKNRPHPLDISS